MLGPNGDDRVLFYLHLFVLVVLAAQEPHGGGVFLGTGLGLFLPLIYGGWEVLHILIRVAGSIVNALWLITVVRKPLPRWFALPF